MNRKPMLIRLTTFALVGALTISATGCSAVMGMLGMEEESAVTETESVAETDRTLLPTPPPPVVEVAATPTEEVAELPAVVEEPVVLAQPEPSAPARRAVTITGPTVNLRSQPGTDAQILRTVPAGTQFDFVDQNGAGDWYQVCCIDNQMAWVFAELAKVEEAVALPQSGTALQVPALASASRPENSGPKLTTLVRPVALNIPLTPPVFTQSGDGNGVRYEFSEQGFAITLPSSWQPVDLSTERMTDSLSAFAGANPQAAALVEEQFQRIANARFTFFAAELSPAILDTGFATNVSLLRQPLPDGITLDFYGQLTAKQVQEKFAVTSPIALTPGSLPAGKLVALNYTMSGVNGDIAVTTYLIMQAQTVYDLTFTTTSAQVESYAQTFALIAKSFRLLE